MRPLLMLFMVTSTAMVPGMMLADPSAGTPDVGESVDELPSESLQQINGSVNATTDDLPDEDLPELEEDPDAVTHVDEKVRILAWEHTGEAFVIRFEVDGERPVTLDWAEMVQRTEGSGSYATSTERLLPGTQTVTLPVEPVAGQAGVTLETSASREADSGTYLSTGVTEQSSGPWSATSSAAGWFGGISVGLTMMIGAAWQAKRRKYDEPEGYR